MALQRSLFQSTSVRGTTFVGNYYKCTKRSTALARFSADDERSSRASINLNSATSLLLASVCASLGAASGALGMELAGFQQQMQQQPIEVVQETLQFVDEQDDSSRRWSRTARPFDAALTTVINLADTLSLATRDLTAAAAAAELDSDEPTSLQEMGTLAATASAADAAFEAAGSIEQAYLGAASRMSQQAMQVAAEALRLATLLETQQEHDVDPTYSMLLQQIAEAARAVSAAADIAAEPGQWVEEVVDEAAL